MHDSVKAALAKWYGDRAWRLSAKRIADLGAYNLNGSVQDVIDHAEGIDILAGPGVHHVIEPGRIPAELRGKFVAVVAVSSFQFSCHADEFRGECKDLLEPGGLLFLTMSPKGNTMHSTSPNSYGYTDGIRMSPMELCQFFDPCFRLLDLTRSHVESSGGDLIYTGERKP